MKAVIKKVKRIFRKDQYRFVLKGNNGEIIAISENYTQKHNATEVLKEYFPTFVIVDESR